jgi:hypothetical protein
MVRGDGFEIEALITGRAARANVRITEVASTEKARLHGASNLKAVPDGIRVLRTIIAEHRRLHRIARLVVTDQVTLDTELVGEST